MTPPVLPGFEYRRVDVAGVTIHCAVALPAWSSRHLSFRAPDRHVRPVLDGRDLHQRGFADSAGFPSAHVHGAPPRTRRTGCCGSAGLPSWPDHSGDRHHAQPQLEVTSRGAALPRPRWRGP